MLLAGEPGAESREGGCRVAGGAGRAAVVRRHCLPKTVARGGNRRGAGQVGNLGSIWVLALGGEHCNNAASVLAEDLLKTLEH